jgi:hypothetical protein
MGILNPYFFTMLVVLETAHVVSPFVVSWMHAEFRKVMLADPVCYIASSLRYSSLLFFGLSVSLEILVKVYMIFNFWHFGMQNYGVLKLFCSMVSRISLPTAFLGTAIGMYVFPLGVQIHHWLRDIWLSQRVSGTKRWFFLVIIFSLAPVALCWNTPATNPTAVNNCDSGSVGIPNTGQNGPSY